MQQLNTADIKQVSGGSTASNMTVADLIAIQTKLAFGSIQASVSDLKLLGDKAKADARAKT